MDELSDLERPGSILLLMALTAVCIIIAANVADVGGSLVGYLYFGPIPLVLSGFGFIHIGRLIHGVADRISKRGSRR